MSFYYGSVSCNCFKNGFPLPPPDVIKEFVFAGARGIPELRFPVGYRRRSQNKRQKHLDNWIKSICPHRHQDQFLVNFSDYPEYDFFFDFIREQRFDYDGTEIVDYIPSLNKYHPEYHRHFPAGEASQLLMDLEALKIQVNPPFYTLYPSLIDQLILLCQASIDTGNPIEWY